jgi:hypothetical protein
MFPGSPWYHFHPEGLGWLARREAIGEPIYADDVQRVINANPEAVSTPELQLYVRRLKDGEIGPRKGRPRAERSNMLIWLKLEYEDRLGEIKEKQRRGELPKKLESGFSPCEQAANEIVRAYRQASGRSLLNTFSLEKSKGEERTGRSRAFFMNERARKQAE